MAKYHFLLIGLLLAGCTADASAPSASLPPPSRHDALESPAAIKTTRLQYGEGQDLGHPDQFATVITAPGAYPTDHDALHAFQRADRKFFGAYRPRLFACAPGALDGATGRVDPYLGKPVVHCATLFVGTDGRRLGQIPINYYYYDSKWRLRDPETVFAAPVWTHMEPTLPQVRGKAVE